MTFTRRFLTLAFVFMLAMPAGVAIAQDEASPDASADVETPFAFGVEDTATFVDQRGNPVLSLTVNSMDVDWSHADGMYEPERGMRFVVLNLSITNLTSRETSIYPFNITLLDSSGAAAQQGYIYDDEAFWSDEVIIGAGETSEGSIAYMMYTDFDPMLLMWQPEFPSFIFVYLGD